MEPKIIEPNNTKALEMAQLECVYAILDQLCNLLETKKLDSSEVLKKFSEERKKTREKILKKINEQKIKTAMEERKIAREVAPEILNQ